ncbi:hypothetical protein NKG94_22295 [Micromonospora sp. M12]
MDRALLRQDQGLTAEDGKWLVANGGVADIPASWSEAIARHQETIDLLAKETGNKPLKAEDLYDRRYESVAADALLPEGPDERPCSHPVPPHGDRRHR